MSGGPQSSKRLRKVIAACCGAACVFAGLPGPAAAQASGHDHAVRKVRDVRADDARIGLLRAAEAALAAGDAAAAVASFEQAAAMLHSADTEMGLVRAWLQQGEYRRALAFAAHTAGAHRDTPAASALYAWLLSIGGQDQFAKRVLGEPRSSAPEDRVVADTRLRLATRGATTTPAMREAPHRMAPHALMLGGQPALPTSARVTAGGVLLADGRHALVPLGALSREGSPMWVRDGLGRTTAVVLERRLPALELALVRLTTPLDSGGVAPALRDPFAGSPAHVVGYATPGDAEPAWPWMYSGFAGSTNAAGARRLGVDVPASVPGAPVFDALGHWSGVAVRDTQGRDALIGISRLREELGALVTGLEAPRPVAAGEPAPSRRMTPEEIYERGLRVALQVLMLAPAP